jgi:hypothetical protein
MPSNAMKASQLGRRLLDLADAHGDPDCVFVSGGVIAIDGRNITLTTEIGEQKLPRPVIAFGVTTDDRGRRRSSPGEVYQKTITAGEPWNYNKAEAPEDTPLLVWKRRAVNGAAEDRGYRQGERWFVYEGGARAWEIVPDGVLGWRLP